MDGFDIQTVIDENLPQDSKDGVLDADNQRRIVKSFSNDEKIRKYVLMESLDNESLSKDRISTIGDILLLRTPELELIKQEAESDESVKERRLLQIENKSRESIIYNEGVRYGAQIALKSTLATFNEYILKESSSLDRIYPFENYLLHGKSVMPPIINVSQNGLIISGDILRKYDYKYEITSEAKFVSNPPNYRDYLSFSQYQAKLPATFNIPTTPNETTHWMNGVYDGWLKGDLQAKVEIDSAIKRLNLDFMGVVRFHALHKKNMVSSPIISTSRKGLDGNDKKIELGVVTLKMEARPSFELDAGNWSPILMLDKLEMEQYISNKKGGI